MLTAALVVIGDEILSGRVADVNTPFLARRLHAKGIALRRVVVVPDEVDEIARELTIAKAKHDLVFTSGGVGPTHDDVTMEGVGRAFGVEVTADDRLVALMKRVFTEERWRGLWHMCEIPAGATLIPAGEGKTGRWPVVRVDNVYVLPGIPELFQAKILHLEHRFGGAPSASRSLRTSAVEAELARPLEDIAHRHPMVKIGSYPTMCPEAGYRVELVIEGPSDVAVEAVLAEVEAMVATLDPS